MTQNINYQHLYYFWNVVRENSFTKASKKLGLAQPTISGQIATFEKSLGSKLISRQGRRICLTESGHIVYTYADKIFDLGNKMKEDIKLSTFTNHHSIVIGCRNSIPSQVIRKFSDFIFDQNDDYRLTCLTNNNSAILNGVTKKHLDAAITDEPLSYFNGLPLYAHLLSESEISLMCHSRHFKQYKTSLADLLMQYPCIIPSQNTRLRYLVDTYLTEHQIKPIMISEIENYDFILSLAKDSPYLIFTPTIIMKDIRNYIEFHEIQRLPNIKIKYYAVTLNKKPDKDIISYSIEKFQNLCE